MPQSLALAGMYSTESPAESPDRLPPEVSRLLTAAPGQARDEAWAKFLACYSGLLLRVATAFAAGYDGALDRYAFMLDELRKAECRRLRKFAADGRGRFSTWLTVVARRLCLDHHRRQYGRFRGTVASGSHRSLAWAARRQLERLDAERQDFANLPALLESDPTDEIEDRDLRILLHRAVGQLPPGDRLLLRLRFEQDLTAREMATVLGLPSPFHVYRRLDAIYRVLRANLGAVRPRRQLLGGRGR
jgi:RNA polymerase sigma factor (sigma-70 family)